MTMTSETQMYGMTKQDVQDLIDDSYTKMVGASMVAMGMLSDIQEVLYRSSDRSIDKESIRQQLNVAKRFIHEGMMDKGLDKIEHLKKNKENTND